MKRRGVQIVLAVLVVCLLAVALGACGGADSSSVTTAGVATTTAGSAPGAATGTPAGEAVSRVASQALIDAIGTGAKKDAVVRPVYGWLVSSATLPGIYFVAMEFSGSRENYRGIWATDDIDGAGSFWAVDEVAQKYTTWPKGGDADPTITVDDPAAQQAFSKL